MSVQCVDKSVLKNLRKHSVAQGSMDTERWQISKYIDEIFDSVDRYLNDKNWIVAEASNSIDVGCSTPLRFTLGEVINSSAVFIVHRISKSKESLGSVFKSTYKKRSKDTSRNIQKQLNQSTTHEYFGSDSNTNNGDSRIDYSMLGDTQSDVCVLKGRVTLVSTLKVNSNISNSIDPHTTDISQEDQIVTYANRVRVCCRLRLASGKGNFHIVTRSSGYVQQPCGSLLDGIRCWVRSDDLTMGIGIVSAKRKYVTNNIDYNYYNIRDDQFTNNITMKPMDVNMYVLAIAKIPCCGENDVFELNVSDDGCNVRFSLRQLGGSFHSHVLDVPINMTNGTCVAAHSACTSLDSANSIVVLHNISIEISQRTDVRFQN